MPMLNQLESDNLLLEELECASASDTPIIDSELPSNAAVARRRRVLGMAAGGLFATVIVFAVLFPHWSTGIQHHSSRLAAPQVIGKDELLLEDSATNMPEQTTKDTTVSTTEALRNTPLASDDDEKGGKGKTEEKVEEKEEEEEDGKCAAAGASCLKSHCCKEAGHQCYTKNKFWAQCMATCTPGPNPLDQVSPMPWECKALGSRTPGEPKKLKCAEDGQDCTQSKCCVTGGTQCYQKNSNWAVCKAACTAGPDLMDEDPTPWSCKALGPRTMGAAPWVAKQCAAGGTDCSKQACCATPGHQCYRQSPYYAQCKPSCTKGEKPNAWDHPWDCTPIGMRTPSLASASEGKGKIASWVVDKCASAGENCLDSQCCHAVNGQCYTKNKYYASCKTECSTEPDPNDGNKTWSCNALGPRSWGLAVKGYPSIYCFTLYMPSRYEGPLMKAQLKAGAGIFSCDGYDVLSADPDTLGVSKDGVEVKAMQIPKIAVGVSQDGTAGNAKLFMAVWDKIIADNKFRNYDWTIKVDPDAVIIPWRVRQHMEAHTGKNVYVVNCNKFPGSPNFPMMYGAVEIFSNLAMDAYSAGSWKCGTQLPWKSWGEDYYMTHCLDFLGVGRIGDFGVLGDNLCTGANCGDSYTASFHPFKEIGLWMQCWGKATAPPPPAKPAAPAAPAR